MTALARRGETPPTCTARQDGGHPAGEVQAVLSPIHQPQAAGEAVHLSFVSFSIPWHRTHTICM